jgi:hypothetical protein
MASFVIAPPDATEWRMTPEQLEAGLRNRWPGATVQPSESPSALARFTAEIDEGEPADGYLASDGVSLWMESGTLADAAALAAWYREQAPDDVELELADESYDGEVAVEPGMDPETIAEQYEAGFA